MQASANVHALAEACARCARHSHAILIESWIDGSFKPFDFSYTHYLFSVAIILAVSSLLGGSAASGDEEDFELSSQLLIKLEDLGSFTAIEFNQHIEAIKTASRNPFSTSQNPDSLLVQQSTSTYSNINAHTELSQIQPSVTTNFMTANMALSEPSIEAFLLQSGSSLGQTDSLDGLLIEELDWPVFETL